MNGLERGGLRKFLGSISFYRQRVNFTLHHIAQGGIDHAMAGGQGLAAEMGGDQGEPVMPAAAGCAGMPGVTRALIIQYQMLGRQRSQFLLDPVRGGGHAHACIA